MDGISNSIVYYFHELRQRLAECRATCRTNKDLHEQAQAQAEQAAIDAGQAGGKNAEERARSLTIALMGDPSYQGALARLRRAESEVERVEALLEAAKDERRASEWQIRMRLADGLFRAGVPNDDQAGDEAFDDVADAELDGTLDDGLDADPDADYQAERYSSSYGATLRRQPSNGTEELEELPF